MTKMTLKAARVNAGLTQAQVALGLGVSTKTVANWESGVNSIPAKALLKMCDLYHISINDIDLP